jgi:cytochrome c5
VPVAVVEEGVPEFVRDREFLVLLVDPDELCGVVVTTAPARAGGIAQLIDLARDVAIALLEGPRSRSVGEVSYWNAYVAVTQMGAQGTFVNEEMGIDIESNPDLVTPKLPALRDYQFSLATPTADPAGYDAAAAARGEVTFDAACASCHAGDAYTDAPILHTPEEVGQDPLYASRGTTGLYRSTSLRGLALHPPYFHDGSAATLADVVARYDAHLALGLTAAEQADLVGFLDSL